MASPTVNPKPNPSRPLHLRLSPAGESAVRRGHPWVYESSVREQSGPGAAGDLAVVYDRLDRFLALGLWDPDSPLRLRVLHVGKPVRCDVEWWRGRLRTTLDRRRPWFDDATTGFRWIHGESDGWPGLVLDRYGETLVLKIYSPVWLPRVTDLVGWIRDELHPQRIVLRLSRNSQSAAAASGYRDGQNLHGEDDAERVTFLESGLRFESEVVKGQKTGFFLDQRENRRRVETLSAGQDVLNVFSFSGGFSLYAARGGAARVVDVDISGHALAQARRNFALNLEDVCVKRAVHEQVQADAFHWLSERPSRRFGLVVLDPPSLAKSEAERQGAIEAYRKLVRSGLDWVKPGGVLLAASCSAHVSTEEFYGTVRQVLLGAGRQAEEFLTEGHPQDHAATFREAEYLKAIYWRLRG